MPVENQITTLSVVKIAIKFSPCGIKIGLSLQVSSKIDKRLGLQSYLRQQISKRQLKNDFIPRSKIIFYRF